MNKIASWIIALVSVIISILLYIVEADVAAIKVAIIITLDFFVITYIMSENTKENLEYKKYESLKKLLNRRSK